MKNITVKIYNSKEQIAITKLTTNDGKPTIIKSQKGVNYEFLDHIIDKAPNHIVTKRHGDDLYVSFERFAQSTDLLLYSRYW